MVSWPELVSTALGGFWPPKGLEIFQQNISDVLISPGERCRLRISKTGSPHRIDHFSDNDVGLDERLL
jgi:hypothetical protein